MREPTVDSVPISVIESWLYEIAINNSSTYFSSACKEIISRLGGLKRYYEEIRERERCHGCKRETERERERCLGRPSCSCCDYDYKERDDIPCSICSHNGGLDDFWQHKSPFGIAGVIPINKTKQSTDENEEV